MLVPVHLLTQMDSWDYLRGPIIEQNFGFCFDIGEVPKSPGKLNCNQLNFLPVISIFKQGAKLHIPSMY